jgi:hypothetical protein
LVEHLTRERRHFIVVFNEQDPANIPRRLPLGALLIDDTIVGRRLMRPREVE